MRVVSRTRGSFIVRVLRAEEKRDGWGSGERLRRQSNRACACIRPVYFDMTEKVKPSFDAAGISIPYPQSEVHLLREGG